MTDPGALLSSHLGVTPRSPEEQVLRLLIELSAQVVDAQEGSLLVLDRSQEPPRELVFAMTVGSSESERALLGQRVPIGEGLTGLAALTHAVQIGAPSYDGVQQAERGEAPAGVPTAVIAAPMLIGDSLVGVITAASFEAGKRFSSQDAALYARAASVAGVVVDQRRRLAVVEAVRDGAPLPPPIGERERIERDIVRLVSRILRADTARLAEVARLLSSLDALTGSSPQ